MKKETVKFNIAKINVPYLFTLLFIAALFSSPVLGQHYAYVTNAGEFGDDVQDDLSIIDLATNTVIATVPLGHYPQGLAINPAGTAVYTANSLSNDFTVIDTVNHTSTTIPGGLVPVGVAVHPDGTRIYIANVDFMNEGISTVSVVDRATNAIIDEVFCGNGSIGVTMHPDGTVAYVTNTGDGTIAVLDTETHQVTDAIALKTSIPDEIKLPVPIVVHPAGTYIYAANRLGPTFWAIDAATHESIAIPFGHRHVGIAVNPEGTVIYLPDFNDEDPNLPPQGTTVDVIDAKTLELITTIDGLKAPLDVSVHPDGKHAYIMNTEDDSVVVIDTATYSPIETIPVGIQPNGYGECVGPGVPRMLKEDAVARLQAVTEIIEANTNGIGKPEQALKHLDDAITSGNLSIHKYLWSSTDSGEVDPRRLNPSLGDTVFWSEVTMIEAVIDTIRRGWVLNGELRSELLSIVDEIIRADRVLVAVVIDDAIVAIADSGKIAEAQEILEKGDALVKQAAIEQGLDGKISLLQDAIDQYRNAWEAALD
ncbi:MAG: beta-propeller fold lactonase family protein [Planctomycetota bacterium]|jgi:YVTN family beta-propeller protein